LVLPTSLPLRLSSLPEAPKCVSHFELRPYSQAESCKYLYFFFSYVCICYVRSLIFYVLSLATSPIIYKHIIRHHNCSRWDPPPYLQFITREARMQSFNTMPLSGKYFAKSLIEAVFFFTGKLF